MLPWSRRTFILFYSGLVRGSNQTIPFLFRFDDRTRSLVDATAASGRMSFGSMSMLNAGS